MTAAVPHPIAGLYVPGDRPDRFEKAVESGADLVVLDLEDAVATERKEYARREVVAWLSSRRVAVAPILQVRVNAGDRDDLAAVATLPAGIEVRLPKVAGPEDVDRAEMIVPGRPVTALVEGAAGVFAAREIAAHAAVTRVALGEADLRSAIGPADAVVEFARLQLVFAAAAAGIESPMMSVYPAIADPSGLDEDTREGARLGFLGRMAAHPKQIVAIVEAFRPTAQERRWATEVMERTAAGGVSTMEDGSMVDPAMRARAERILSFDATRRTA